MHNTAAAPFRKPNETFAQGAKSLPQKYFVSPDIFARELSVIFAAQWVLVGHQSQIPHAGDCFVTEVANESLIIARDKDQSIHAFYNVCRHRGTRLCENAVGAPAA